MPQPLTIVLVEKTGELKTLSVKDYKEDELFKKCGFKKADDFTKQAEWPIKFDGQKYTIAMYGKTAGKANMENKYDFPPPVDSKLFFGCCVLVGHIRDDNNNKSPQLFYDRNMITLCICAYYCAYYYDHIMPIVPIIMTI